jgi:hypothetical protein
VSALRDGRRVDADPEQARVRGGRRAHAYPRDDAFVQRRVFERGRQVADAGFERLKVVPESKLRGRRQRQLHDARLGQNVHGRAGDEALIARQGRPRRVFFERAARRQTRYPVLQECDGFEVGAPAGFEPLARA